LNIDIHIEQVDPFDYEENVLKILNIYKKYKKDVKNIIVNVTGGTRVMTLGAFTAAHLIGAEIHYLKEGSNTPIKIKSPNVPIFGIHEIQKCILLLLLSAKSEETITQKSIRIKLKNLSKFHSTKLSAQDISYHCKELEKNGLINRIKIDGRSNKLQLTTMGKIYASFLKK